VEGVKPGARYCAVVAAVAVVVGAGVAIVAVAVVVTAADGVGVDVAVFVVEEGWMVLSELTAVVRPL